MANIIPGTFKIKLYSIVSFGMSYLGLCTRQNGQSYLPPCHFCTEARWLRRWRPTTWRSPSYRRGNDHSLEAILFCRSYLRTSKHTHTTNVTNYSLTIPKRSSFFFHGKPNGGSSRHTLTDRNWLLSKRSFMNLTLNKEPGNWLRCLCNIWRILLSVTPRMCLVCLLRVRGDRWLADCRQTRRYWSIV